MCLKMTFKVPSTSPKGQWDCPSARFYWHWGNLIGNFECNFQAHLIYQCFEYLLWIGFIIGLMYLPQYFTDQKSTLVQVMAWCHQATSHYLNQCWPKSMFPYGVTRHQWDKENWWVRPVEYIHGFVGLCFVEVILLVTSHLCVSISHILQGCFTSTGAMKSSYLTGKFTFSSNHNLSIQLKNKL